MKRERGLLRRGLTVVSTAALAIAGAIIAAPAAHGAPATNDAVRPTPVADAGYVGTDGQLTGSFVSGASYSGTVSTGTAEMLSGSNQLANGLQIALTSDTGSGNWAANDTVTVTLPTGVTFSGSAPSASVDTTLVDLTSLDSVAGFSGSDAHLANAVSGGTALGSSSVTSSVSGSVLTMTLAAADPGGASSGQGYVLSVSDIRVNVDNATFNSGHGGAITATIAGSAGVTGKTTTGYVAPATISVPSGSTVAYGSGNHALPNVTVAESAPDGFNTGNQYKITATAQPGGTPLSFDTTPPTVTGSTGVSVTTTTPSGNVATFKVTGQSSSTTDTVTISGLTITSTIPVGETVHLALTQATAPKIPVTAVETASSSFSYAPDFTTAADIATTVPRIAGPSRYSTAAKIAAAGSWSGKAVVIANGETYKQGVDALSANYLAGWTNAPILLTEADSLPSATLGALVGLFTGGTSDVTVYVMGKTDSVSTSVRSQITSAIDAALSGTHTATIQQVAGPNRFATSAAAATTPPLTHVGFFNIGSGSRATAILASGIVNADALAAGSLSAGADIPVLLTGPTSLPSAVCSALQTLNIKQVMILGASDRVSSSVVSALAGCGVTDHKRIAGSSRYETAAMLYKFTAASPFSLTPGGPAYIANGTAGFPDALSVGPLAAATQSPVLTVPVATLPTPTQQYLTNHKTALSSSLVVLGHTDRVSAAVATAAQAAM